MLTTRAERPHLPRAGRGGGRRRPSRRGSPRSRPRSRPSARDSQRSSRRSPRETARLAVLERQYAAALAVLEQHLRAIYESDSPDLIAFALGTTSFSDLLDNLDLLNRIGRQDERIASTLDRARTELERTRAATERARRGAARSEALIAARTEAQRATRDRIVASRDALAAAESAKAERPRDGAGGSRLVRGRGGRASRRRARRSRDDRGRPERRRRPPPRPPARLPPSSSGGQLGWPVAGPVTSGFGSRWGRMHEGIDIAVGSGTPVHAAAAGTVIYAGWMSRLREHRRDRPRQRALDRVRPQLEPRRRSGRDGRQGLRRSRCRAARGTRRARTSTSRCASTARPSIRSGICRRPRPGDRLKPRRRLRGVGRRGRQGFGRDVAEVGQRAPALLEPEAVAGEQLVRHREADVAEADVLDEAAVGAVEQRDGRDARRAALRERPRQERERQPRVDDVLDEDDVAAPRSACRDPSAAGRRRGGRRRSPRARSGRSRAGSAAPGRGRRGRRRSTSAAPRAAARGRRSRRRSQPRARARARRSRPPRGTPLRRGRVL